MYTRSFGLALVGALLLGLTGGCKKSAPGEGTSNETQPLQGQKGPPRDLVASLHWLGIKRVGLDTNSAHFMPVWNLPETAKLKDQTLDKLALWLAEGAKSGSNYASVSSNQVNTPIRPLLEDLIEEESYLEISSPTNQPGELAFAIRLAPGRSLFWETNLASFVESCTQRRPVRVAGTTFGWQLNLTNQPIGINQTSPASAEPRPISAVTTHLELTRSADWTFFALSRGSSSTVADFRARFGHDRNPFPASTTNFWLDAQFELPAVARALALNWSLPQNCPKVAMDVFADGQDVRIQGQIDFPQSFPVEPEAWNIPTNLIHFPLVGFTSARGFRPWLSSFKPWADLQLGAAPNQAYLWSQKGLPLQNYFATPLTGASNVVDKVSAMLQQTMNPWLADERLGAWQNSTGFHGVVWNGAPFIAPEFRSISDTNGEFVCGGLINPPSASQPLPPELLHELDTRTNLLLYDWEITADGLEHGLYVSQLLRLFSHKAQLLGESASLTWLHNITHRLGNCVTTITESHPGQFLVTRRSTIGLHSIELHAMADWLESPQFPHGLYSLLTPAPPSPAEMIRTNAMQNIRK